MKSSNCPLAFWDYCVERQARINNLTAKDLFQLHRLNPYTDLTCKEGDIWNLCRFDFYEWCYCRDHKAPFPHNCEVLGRVLGPASGEGNEMAQWLLKSTGRVVPRRTVRPLTVDELNSDAEQQKQKLFKVLIERRHGLAMIPLKKETGNNPGVGNPDNCNVLEPYLTLEEPAKETPDMNDCVNANGKLINQQPIYDLLLNAEVQLHLGKQLEPGKVVGSAVGPDGEQVGTYDLNPILNTIMYEVEFNDGQIWEYDANTIASNIIGRVDSDGFSSPNTKAIVDYHRNPDVAVESSAWVVDKRGKS